MLHRAPHNERPRPQNHRPKQQLQLCCRTVRSSSRSFIARLTLGDAGPSAGRLLRGAYPPLGALGHAGPGRVALARRVGGHVEASDPLSWLCWQGGIAAFLFSRTFQYHPFIGRGVAQTKKKNCSYLYTVQYIEHLYFS